MLYLTAKDPAGRELWTWSWSLIRNTPSPKREALVRTPKLQKREDDGILAIGAGKVELVFSKQKGTLVEVAQKGALLPFGLGPNFVAFRRNDRKYDDIAGQSTLTHFASPEEGKEVVVESTYSGPLRYVRWRIAVDGASGLKAQLDYEYAFDGVVDMVGVQFKSPERPIDRIRWLGRGPYQVWQNRMEGTRLDVWENAYNDSTPGERWIYPEFKGYFRDWRWAAFDTPNGRITISTEAPDSFLGLFKPKGVNGLLDLPDIGIAFLEVIPAMRNKFHTTDEIGPQSKAKQVSGTVRRTVYFRFGE